MVQVTTDNKNRAASEVRSIFTKHGGNLAGAGAVMFQFHHCGQILVRRETVAEDRLMELALEAGADDVSRVTRATSCAAKRRPLIGCSTRS